MRRRTGHCAVANRKGDRAGSPCHIAAGKYAGNGGLFHRIGNDGRSHRSFLDGAAKFFYPV